MSSQTTESDIGLSNLGRSNSVDSENTLFYPEITLVPPPNARRESDAVTVSEPQPTHDAGSRYMAWDDINVRHDTQDSSWRMPRRHHRSRGCVCHTPTSGRGCLICCGGVFALTIVGTALMTFGIIYGADKAHERAKSKRPSRLTSRTTIIDASIPTATVTSAHSAGRPRSLEKLAEQISASPDDWMAAATPGPEDGQTVTVETEDSEGKPLTLYLRYRT